MTKSAGDNLYYRPPTPNSGGTCPPCPPVIYAHGCTTNWNEEPGGRLFWSTKYLLATSGISRILRSIRYSTEYSSGKARFVQPYWLGLATCRLWLLKRRCASLLAYWRTQASSNWIRDATFSKKIVDDFNSFHCCFIAKFLSQCLSLSSAEDTVVCKKTIIYKFSQYRHDSIDPACIDHYARAVSEWTKDNTVSFGLRDMIRRFRDCLGR